MASQDRVLLVEKQSNSETDFLVVTTSSNSFSKPTNEQATSFSIDQIQQPRILGSQDFALLLANGEIYASDLDLLSALNSGTDSCKRELKASSISNAFENCPKFVELFTTHSLYGAKTEDGRFYLFSDEVQLEEMFGGRNVALETLKPSLQDGSNVLVLALIDHNKWFNGEQIVDMHETMNGVIFRTSSNSFYAAAELQGSLSEQLPYKLEEGQAEPSGEQLFYKLNIPTSVQKFAATRESELVYIADGNVFYSSPKVKLHQVDLQNNK